MNGISKPSIQLTHLKAAFSRYHAPKWPFRVESSFVDNDVLKFQKIDWDKINLHDFIGLIDGFWQLSVKGLLHYIPKLYTLMINNKNDPLIYDVADAVLFKICHGYDWIETVTQMAPDQRAALIKVTQFLEQEIVTSSSMEYSEMLIECFNKIKPSKDSPPDFGPPLSVA